jgi:hypothetical protein
MTKSKPRLSVAGSSATPVTQRPPGADGRLEQGPEDALARAWIAALQPLAPTHGEPAGPQAALEAAEHWAVETLLKLGFAAPDCAYQVAVRIVELSDDPWILETVGVSVIDELIRRDGARFIARLSGDARQSPHLRRARDHIPAAGLDRAADTRLEELPQARC